VDPLSLPLIRSGRNGGVGRRGPAAEECCRREKYTQERLYGEVWKRQGLNRRDRSIVTVAALVARNLTLPMRYYLGEALDYGVKPRELSEIITHLAFYSGWANAFTAIGPAKDVFAERGIGSDQLPAASPPLLPLNEAAEADRVTRVGQQFGSVAPGLVEYTADPLFRDLWLAAVNRSRWIDTETELVRRPFRGRLRKGLG
jgi:4-carboxymuconolactone decarboxylase